MIVSATLMPHAPILLEEIGGKDSKKAIKTINAMENIAETISDSDPETIVIISPHSFTWEDRFIIPINKIGSGSFFDFGHSEIKYEQKLDQKLGIEIVTKLAKKDFPVYSFYNEKTSYDLDHGILVPLHFILKNTTSVKILPMSYSFLPYTMHIKYGQKLFKILDKSKKRIAIIASGDLSHRLLDPDGFGKKFDDLLIKNLKNNDLKKIYDIDPKLIENTGECGYRSLLILLGAISGLDTKTKVLSYEGPLGVGYGVANFEILNPKF